MRIMDHFARFELFLTDELMKERETFPSNAKLKKSLYRLRNIDSNKNSYSHCVAISVG